MQFTTSFVLLSAVAGSLAAMTFDVNVGKGGLIFEPSTVTAPMGSMINFHFYPGDHSVAQSTFSKPCVPSGSDAIYSGFINPSSGVDDMMFTVMVNNTDPMWLYCSQGHHCEAGMVMVINPPSSGDSLAMYKMAASQVSSSMSPAKVEGGIIQANKKGSSSMSSSMASMSSSMASSMMSSTATMMSSMASMSGSATMSAAAASSSASSSGAASGLDMTLPMAVVGVAGGLWAWALI